MLFPEGRLNPQAGGNIQPFRFGAFEVAREHDVELSSRPAASAFGHRLLSVRHILPLLSADSFHCTTWSAGKRPARPSRLAHRPTRRLRRFSPTLRVRSSSDTSTTCE